jgi:hypothetical protein
MKGKKHTLQFNIKKRLQDSQIQYKSSFINENRYKKKCHDG